MRILVVEDDKKVASFLAQGLREDGYAVDIVGDGLEATRVAETSSYDLVLLDVMLPGRSGLEVVHNLRQARSQVPILLLTARDATQDVVRGLDAGADDYLTKPFSYDELLARVRALLRRGGPMRTESLVYTDVVIDRLQHTARRAGQDLDLTPKEFQLLEFFLLRPEEVIRRTELLEKIWGFSFDPGSNLVDVHVANLRRRLTKFGGRQLIHTIRGVGYMMHHEENR
jgi:DNA-binding response OmpR family regulator